MRHLGDYLHCKVSTTIALTRPGDAEEWFLCVFPHCYSGVIEPTDDMPEFYTVDIRNGQNSVPAYSKWNQGATIGEGSFLLAIPTPGVNCYSLGMSFSFAVRRRKVSGLPPAAATSAMGVGETCCFLICMWPEDTILEGNSVHQRQSRTKKSVLS